ncbi:MAG TPA: hypothetical protein VG248_03495 [Caulobacteraceae bacterium]|nr:hypothetical protein [Caulobacteraceae bacterium]
MGAYPYSSTCALPGTNGSGGTGGNTAVTPTDAAGTIATGGTFQTVFASNSSRTNCLIANPITATETLFVHYTAASATTSNSIGLAAGAAFTCNGSGVVVTGAIQVEATTTGHAFVATGS